MKKTVILALAGIISSQITIAQTPAGQLPAGPRPSTPPTTAPAVNIPKGNGKISGVILDDISKKPVEFATVTLLNKATNKTVDGSITDDKGKFSIVKIASGNYKISVSFLGYETKFVEEVTIGAAKSDINLGTISLKADAKALKEVSVTGEKPLVEDKVDRMVYNAEKDITNIGGTAGDVLKKVPGLTVDLDGNVQLRGSSNIRVLINNKPSSIMASSIADALRQIPSDQIKTVEVITSPSAKYDAEGSAGIINIITKKNNLQGLNGNVNLSYGTRNSNANGNVNYRKGKLGINTGIGTNFNNNPGFITSETDYLNVPVYTPADPRKIDYLQQTTTGRREGTFQFLQLGADYDINKTNSLAAGVRMHIPSFSFKTDQDNTSFFNNSTSEFNRRINTNSFSGTNYDLNLDYTKTFKKPQQELSFLALFSNSARNNDNDTDQQNFDGSLTGRERNYNEANNQEFTFQSDYVHPFAANKIFEIGAKAILRHAESDFKFSKYNFSADRFDIVPALANIFNYQQNVVSTYATYGFSLNKKYNFKVGGRLEHTSLEADFTNSTLPLTNYDNFIPSVAISRDLKNNQKLKFNFTQRIQRPQLFFLNPYQNLSDPKNVQRGNPNLDAELTNAYELSYSTFFKTGTSINASLYWRQTNNSIESFAKRYEGTNPDSLGRITTTFGNIGRNGTYGMSLFGNTKVLQKGNISGNVNFFYQNINSPSLDITAGAMMFNANLNASWAFEKGFSAQMFGFFNSPRLTLQGKSGSFSYYNFAVKKDLFKKKMGISAGVDNPFSESIVLKNNAETANFDFENNLRVYNRQFRISMNYQFGKMDFKSAPKKKKKISNDDAKSGGDGAAQ